MKATFAQELVAMVAILLPMFVTMGLWRWLRGLPAWTKETVLWTLLLAVVSALIVYFLGRLD